MSRNLTAIASIAACLMLSCQGSIAPPSDQWGVDEQGNPIPPTPPTPNGPNQPPTPPLDPNDPYGPPADGDAGAPDDPYGPYNPPAPDSGLPAVPGKPKGQCTESAAGKSPLRRLTRAEYTASVQDLLGDNAPEAAGFSSDGVVAGLVTNVNAPVSATVVEEYVNAAIAISTRSMSKFSTLLGCNPTTVGELACAKQFIASFGKKAFRRPLTAAEQGRLEAIYTNSRTAIPADFNNAVRIVVATILASPQFLYHVELGATQGTSGTVALTQYELASRLSFFLTGSTPDAELLAAADGNKLTDAVEYDKQARRLLTLTRAKARVRQFAAEWLELEKVSSATKSATLYPNYNAALADAMNAETLAFVEDVVFKRDATFKSIMTDPHSFANASLASVYGLANVTGTALVPVTLDSARASVLSHLSFFTGHSGTTTSSPTIRGKFVYSEVLCRHVTPPPPGIDATPPPLLPGQTTRDRINARMSNALCASCHSGFDPIGLGFETFDAIGKRRTTENGVAVDDVGDLTRMGDITVDPAYGADAKLGGPFRGAAELSGRLGQSVEAHDCFSRKWFAFALGRPRTLPEQCSEEKLQVAFRGTGNVKELMVAAAKTHAFKNIETSKPEACTP